MAAKKCSWSAQVSNGLKTGFLGAIVGAGVRIAQKAAKKRAAKKSQSG